MLHGEALQAGAFDLDEAKRIAEGLDDSYLFIQGPPGSGKTYTGAHLILHLIEWGHRVGVASGTHAAIHNLLAEVEEYAPPGKPFAGLKKYSDESNRYESKRGLIGNSNDMADFTDRNYDLVAGTAWLFCREELDATLDYLLIDEAGQVSLADALAMGTCARNVILLGDPQQLAQVSQAIHPPDAGVSVLEHLLGEHTTIPPERGLFIDETRRMHPDVCRFVSQAIYEDRLESFADCADQRIEAPGRLTGTGVRYVPVEHEGNTRSSPEEAETIADLVERSVEGEYDDAGRERSGHLAPEDIMVVAPYNAQVRCLRERLPGRGAGRHRRQVPGSGGGGVLLLDGDLERRGDPAPPGVPVQQEPPERRRVPRAVFGRAGVQSGAAAHPLPQRRADAVGQCALLVCGDGGGGG